MRLILVSLILLATGCQLKPTASKQESLNVYDKNAVRVDTRSAFEFASFHVPGSIHLATEDFLILKDTRTKKRIMDRDLEQTIERLAKRGINPLKSVLLISDKKDSLENKKWNWLLQQLDIRNVSMISLDEFLAQNKTLIPQAEPERVDAWSVENEDEIIKKSDACFVNWSESDCR